MPRQGDYQVDEKDGHDFARAIEEMYDVMVVVELRPSPSRVKGHWLVCATAFQARDTATFPVFRGEEARYPGPNHSTFGGALLWALQKLEMRLQAATALKQLPFAFVEELSSPDKP
jgi:hypothetical protein